MPCEPAAPPKDREKFSIQRTDCRVATFTEKANFVGMTFTERPTFRARRSQKRPILATRSSPKGPISAARSSPSLELCHFWFISVCPDGEVPWR